MSQGKSTAPFIWKRPELKVKFLYRGSSKKGSSERLIRQFPGRNTQWGSCSFDFEMNSREYDWLVVYHDLPKSGALLSQEKLACPQEQTILLTAEPSTITALGPAYLRQFGYILTFQEPWAVKHPKVVFHPPGLMWFYGIPFDGGQVLSWDQMAAMPPLPKKNMISTVCSERAGKTTLHADRVDFTWKLKKFLPELDIFGHGVNPMNDKAEALDSYMFHIVVENHIYKHHITEKLPDAFLGYTLPFYHGAPNASDYFPKDSFIPIDVRNFKRSQDIIRSHLSNNEYNDRLPYIMEARRRVLEEENLFAILNKTICEKRKEIKTKTMGKAIRSRSTLRLINPIYGLCSLLQKAGKNIK